jgi:hypothetical protein
MKIRELRILPPFAIGRLGTSPRPLDNYTVEVDPEHPLDYRRIRGAPTLTVDDASGEIRGSHVPERVEFRDGERFRPVAPFLEVFAVTDDHTLEPLTKGLLARSGLAPSDVRWRVRVANRKVVRRTDHADDLIQADTPWFSTHEVQALTGRCRNFVEGAVIPFGQVRYLRPTDAFPQIRLRFTPAQGLIYGTAVRAKDGESLPPEITMIPPERRVYDPERGHWYRYEVPVAIDDADPDYHGPFANETLPASLFAINAPAPPWLHGNVAVSRGYLDDACDGVVEVALTLGDGTECTAAARVTAGPPVVVPDSLFIRTLADDLDQVLHGPEVPAHEPIEVTRARAEDIVRRAYETVRFLNVAVMNGNRFKGRDPLALDTMPAEEAYDTERMERPVMAPQTVDTLAILALHQQVFTALRGGTPAWFLRILRQPDEAADYTDIGRRKMPALMCGADNNYLALTHRQLDTIRCLSRDRLFDPPLPAAAPDVATPDAGAGAAASPAAPHLTPRNLSAQLHYAAAGNPISSRPEVSIANCTPGLEVDFRAVWRRLFEGIVLREYDNLVVDVDPAPDTPHHETIRALKGHRLLQIRFQERGADGTSRERTVKPIAQKLGPSPTGPFDSVVLATEDNPHGVQPLEWSNALAPVLHQCQGGTVTCDFSDDAAWLEQRWWDDERPPKHISVEMRVRRFFEDGTAMISRVLARPGELTQGLCSPWQNDYRECSCYYWASARPDYVNVEATADGLSDGDNWLQKVRTGSYVPDDYDDERLIHYDELFTSEAEGMGWERWLRLQIRGCDADGNGAHGSPPDAAAATDPNSGGGG